MIPDLKLFSPANARACLAASQYAYTHPCSLVSSLAHGVMIERDDARILAWRGSVSMQDWITDCSAWRVQTDASERRPYQEVHAGFWKAWASVRDQVIALASYGTKPLFVTGHSLGGAMALLCAEGLVRAGIPVAGVYTFGGPRVGNRAWAKAYSSKTIPPHPNPLPEGEGGSGARLGQVTFRLINQCDVVARIPLLPLLSWQGLKEACKHPLDTFHGMGYRHVGTAVFRPALGSTQVNPPLWVLLISDAAGIYREWSQGRIALLADHAVEKYAVWMQGL